MKKNSHPIDDFFREALEDHQVTPSPEGRSAFLEKAFRGPASGRQRWLWWVIPGSVVVLTAVSLLFLNSPEEPDRSAAPVTASSSSLTANPPLSQNKNSEAEEAA